MRRAALLAGLFLAARSLRPQLVGLGPLLPAVRRDLGVSHAVAGLGTIPVLCMGLFAPPAPFVSGRLGSHRALGASLALIGIFGLARAVAPGAALVILLTFPVGIGMGDRGRAASRLGQGALRRPAGVRNGGVRDRHLGRGGRVLGRRGAARARPRRLALAALRLLGRDRGARGGVAVADAGRARARPDGDASAAAAVPLGGRLAPRGCVLPDVVDLLRAQLVAAGRLHRAWLERRQRRSARRADQRRRHPVRVPGRLSSRIGSGPAGPGSGPLCSGQRSGRCSRSR